MTLRTTLLVLISAFALAFAACDSESSTTPATDTGMSTDTGNTDTGVAACSTTNVVGACMNECDLALSRDAITAAATDCGLGCLGDADEAGCSNTCLIAASVDVPPAGQAISEGCSGCYVATIACTIANCIPACLDTASEACQTCQATNCIPAFYACTGYELVCDNTTDDNGDGTIDCDDPSCAESSACVTTP